MKYTLMAFSLNPAELTDPIMHEPTDLGQTLAETGTHRAEVCAGVYVFETQRGWRDMHRLRHQLVSMNKAFVELPFEAALAGFFPPAACDRLLELGKSSGQEISLLNLNRDD